MSEGSRLACRVSGSTAPVLRVCTAWTRNSLPPLHAQVTFKRSRATLMAAGAFSYRSSAASGQEHGPLERIKAVIFDMDGTLTVPVLNFLEMRSRLGLRPEQDILPTIQALPATERERAMAVIEELEEEGVRKMEVQPGALALLAFIAEARVERALMTRNSNTATHVSPPLPQPGREGGRDFQHEWAFIRSRGKVVQCVYSRKIVTLQFSRVDSG